MAQVTVDELREQAAGYQVAVQKEQRQRAAQRRQSRQITETLIFPVMPRTLTQLFTLKRVSYEYGINLVFGMRKDLTEKGIERALGTITKVADGLKRAGFTVTEDARAHAKGWEPGKQAISVSVGGYIQRHAKAGLKTFPFAIDFDGFGTETPNCRLVEKEVIIEAQPRQYTKQMVVECTDGGSDDQG